MPFEGYQWGYERNLKLDPFVTQRGSGGQGRDLVEGARELFCGFEQPLMFSEDLATNIAATRQFLRNCFEKQPSQDDFETMLAFNMMVPPKVRANMAGRTLNIDDILAALKLPVLVTQGAADRLALPAAAKYTVEKISGAKLSLYDGVGHAPFWEDTARFNAELAAFVRTTNQTN
jgi:non-heme chloroperoxidase